MTLIDLILSILSSRQSFFKTRRRSLNIVCWLIWVQISHLTFLFELHIWLIGVLLLLVSKVNAFKIGDELLVLFFKLTGLLLLLLHIWRLVHLLNLLLSLRKLIGHS